ncbi:MAG: DUF229 domain-containing protein [Caldithrix sp.]|nr:MAG: DUF229 domain-containing protein [Caldithrix sp.]
MISVVMAIEILAIGYPGFGTGQTILALAGIFILAIGVALKFNHKESKLFAVTGPTVSSVQFLLIGAWFGLLTGIVEQGLFVFRRWLLERVLVMNPHWFWMKPVANLILFAVIALAILLVARLWLRVVPIRLSGVFIFMAFAAQLLLFPEVHKLAAIILATGLAFQFSKSIVAHARGFLTVVRRTSPWVAGLTAALLLTVYTWKLLPEYRALAKLPPAKPGSANVLLIVLDTVRASSLSVYGYNRPTTPNLEKFARTGVRFESALSSSPWTLPSHGTMFTGRLPHELFASGETPINGGNPILSSHATLAEVLTDNGYITGGFVGNLLYCSHAHGLDRGFAHYEDFLASSQSVFLSSTFGVEIFKKMRRLLKWNEPVRKTAGDINQAFLDWLGDNDQRPFFVFLNYIDAHAPYMPPKSFERKFGDGKPGKVSVDLMRKYEPEKIKKLQDAYDNCIAYLDEEIGKLLESLQVRGVLENTVVIITSDHGEHFGEHDLMLHGNSLYRPLLDVPLLISFPAGPAGKSVPETVSLRDLPATVVDLLGLESKKSFPGSSLRRYWNGHPEKPDELAGAHLAEILVGERKIKWGNESWPSHQGGMISLMADGYHYIKNGNGSEELYDFENDVQELQDLSNTEAGKKVIKQFRLTLSAELSQSKAKPGFKIQRAGSR